MPCFPWMKKKKKSPKDSHENTYEDVDTPPPVLPRISHESPPNPSGLLEKPWRTVEWNQKRSMKDSLRNLQTSSPAVKCLRILIHGPVGAGKSSLINSIDSIFQGRITSGAIAEASLSGHSFTKILQTHYVKGQNHGCYLPFAFCDIMGLEDGKSEGAAKEDLVKILEGHIKDGFEFNPVSTCSEKSPYYNSDPQLSEQIHCLVSVIPANKITLMAEAVIDKMKDVREQASRLRIPQVAILTKVDETCPLVAKDHKLIYRSKKIKQKMQECSNRLGIPMNYIFPVKNYSEEIDLNDEMDMLLLSALENILNFANDYVAVMAPEIVEKVEGCPQEHNFEGHEHCSEETVQGYGDFPRAKVSQQEDGNIKIVFNFRKHTVHHFHFT